jgi:hypothetical protein
VPITIKKLHPLFCAAVLHRATAYDTPGHKRLMQRTTVSRQIMTTAQPECYELVAE